MCSIASGPAAIGFDATAFLDRRRGVHAVAPAACGAMAREPVRRVGAVASSAPTKKRSRDGFDGKVGEREGVAAGKVSVVPSPGQQRRPQDRMGAELDAIRVLHRKAVLLCRGAGRSGAAHAGKDEARFSGAGPRSEAPMEEAAKRRKMFPLKQSTEPAKKQQQRPVQQRATPPPPPNRSVAKPVDMCRGAGRSGVALGAKGDAKFSAAGLRRKAPLEAATKTKKTSALDCAEQPANRKEPVKQQPPVQLAELLIRAKEVQKKRRLMEEIAQAREKCRQEVLEIERTALPDETIYPRDLEELGITCQHAVTRTWRQAHSEG